MKKTLEQLQEESRRRRYIESFKDCLSIVGLKLKSKRVSPKIDYDPEKIREFIKRKMAS